MTHLRLKNIQLDEIRLSVQLSIMRPQKSDGVLTPALWSFVALRHREGSKVLGHGLKNTIATVLLFLFSPTSSVGADFKLYGARLRPSSN